MRITTTYQVTTGTPLVPFTQWRLALYAEDTIKLAPRLTVSTGLRYSFQTSPGTFANFAPRLAFSWAPDKKSTWVLHLREGLFVAPAALTYATEVYRLNGSRQQSLMVYSPTYSSPLTPVPGSIQVATINQFAPNVDEFPAAVFQAGIEHDLPHRWHPEFSFTYAEDWGIFRTRNINAPIVPANVGPAPDPIAALQASRPLAPNKNIFQYENSGHLNGTVLSFTLGQHSYKRFNLNLNAYMLHFKCDAALQIAPPQSSLATRVSLPVSTGNQAVVRWTRRSTFRRRSNYRPSLPLEQDTPTTSPQAQTRMVTEHSMTGPRMLPFSLPAYTALRSGC